MKTKNQKAQKSMSKEKLNLKIIKSVQNQFNLRMK